MTRLTESSRNHYFACRLINARPGPAGRIMRFKRRNMGKAGKQCPVTVLWSLMSMARFTNGPWVTGMSTSNMVISFRLRHPVSRELVHDPRAHENKGKFSGVCIKLYGYKDSTPQFHLGYDVKTQTQRDSMVFCAGIQSVNVLMQCATEISEIAETYAVRAT